MKLKVGRIIVSAKKITETMRMHDSNSRPKLHSHIWKSEPEGVSLIEDEAVDKEKSGGLIKKSASFKELLQEKCKAMGKSISASSMGTFKNRDHKRKPSHSNASSSTSLVSDASGLTSDHFYDHPSSLKVSLTPDQSSVESQENYTWRSPRDLASCNSRPRTNSKFAVLHGSSYARNKSSFHDGVDTNDKSDSDETHSNNFSFTEAYRERGLEEQQKYIPKEPWESLTFVTYPKKLLG